MKNFFFLCFLAFSCSTLCIRAQSSQKKLWVLKNQTIDFTVDPPVASSSNLPGWQTSWFPEGASNGMHDAQGNLLFYLISSGVQETKIINRYGDEIGSYLHIGTGGEVCIIPVPGSSCKYYIVSMGGGF